MADNTQNCFVPKSFALQKMALCLKVSSLWKTVQYKHLLPLTTVQDTLLSRLNCKLHTYLHINVPGNQNCHDIL